MDDRRTPGAANGFRSRVSRGSSRRPRGEVLILTVARWLGSYQILAVQTIIVGAWIVSNLALSYFYSVRHVPDCTYTLNGVTHVRDLKPCSGLHPFDFYPFVLLNLAFSVQAAYAAPMILYAQNKLAAEDSRTTQAQRQTARESEENLAFVAREIASIRLGLASGLSKSYVRTQVHHIRRARHDADRREPPV